MPEVSTLVMVPEKIVVSNTPVTGQRYNSVLEVLDGVTFFDFNITAI